MERDLSALTANNSHWSNEAVSLTVCLLGHRLKYLHLPHCLRRQPCTEAAEQRRHKITCGQKHLNSNIEYKIVCRFKDNRRKREERKRIWIMKSSFLSSLILFSVLRERRRPYSWSWREISASLLPAVAHAHLGNTLSEWHHFWGAFIVNNWNNPRKDYVLM